MNEKGNVVSFVIFLLAFQESAESLHCSPQISKSPPPASFIPILTFLFPLKTRKVACDLVKENFHNPF